MADATTPGFRVRSALFCAFFPQDTIVYDHGGALIGTRDWRDYGHLLTRRSSASTRTSGAGAGTSSADRLGRRSGCERIRQLESDVLSDLPRSRYTEAIF